MLKMVILRPTLLDNFFCTQHIDMEDTLYLSWRAPAGACISQINLKFLNRLYYLRRGAQGPKIWQFEALKGGNHLKSLRNRQQTPSRDRAWQFSELILQNASYFHIFYMKCHMRRIATKMC